MRNQFVGDVNDYYKYKTLNEFSQCRDIYVCWMLNGDIEGHAQLRVQKKLNGERSIIIGITINNTYKPIIDWLHDNFGGSIGELSSAHHKNRMYSWQFRGKKIRWLLIAIKPYLKIKLDEVELLLNAIENIKPKPGTSMIGAKRVHDKHDNTYWTYFEVLEKEIKELREKKKDSRNRC